MQTDVNRKLEDDETGKKQRVFSLFEREPALRNSRRKMRGLKRLNLLLQRKLSLKTRSSRDVERDKKEGKTPLFSAK